MGLILVHFSNKYQYNFNEMEMRLKMKMKPDGYTQLQKIAQFSFEECYAGLIEFKQIIIKYFI